MMIRNSLKVFFGLLITGFVIIVLLSIFPISGLPRMLAVETGSMEPSVSRGSLVFSSPQKDYLVNDIVTFRSKEVASEEVLITHRIVGIEATDNSLQFRTKGDANNSEDMNSVNSADVIGKVSLIIPLLGFLIIFAKTKFGVVILIIVPCAILFWGELKNISKEIKKMRTKKNELTILFICLSFILVSTAATFSKFSDFGRINGNRITTGSWEIQPLFIMHELYKNTGYVSQPLTLIPTATPEIGNFEVIEPVEPLEPVEPEAVVTDNN